MTRTEIARRRLANERLIGRPFASAVEAVRWLGAVQAQDYAGAKWAIGQRVRGCTDADLDAAFDRGDILRTHVLRPTWHAVLPADIRWLLGLTAARVKARMTPYDRHLDLDERTYGRANVAIARALAGGRHLTRGELGDALAGAGIAARGQRLGHVMLRAELEAVVCSGPLRGKQFTYALLDERAPASAPRPRDEALAELARRYFTSHGPAQLVDFAWWSGLTVADGKAAVGMLASELIHADAGGKRYWLAPSRKPAAVRGPTLHLLPNYDEFLIAYRDHAASVDPALVRGLGPRDMVFANHIVVIDGVVVGGWRRTQAKAGIAIAPTLLRKLTRAETTALAAARDRYGRFLALPVTLAPARRAGAGARSTGRARVAAR
jgi:hypothetical protein